MSVRAPLCYQPRYENLGTRLVCYLAKYTSLQSEKLLSVKTFRGIINGDAMNDLPDRSLLDYVLSILACNFIFHPLSLCFAASELSTTDEKRR